MEIDAFTFVAQVFNFALLVYLLRRFLYRPIQEAMKRREEMITSRLTEANTQQKAAEALAEEYRERVRDVEEDREELLDEARREAERLASELSSSLRARMAEREREWRESQGRQASQEIEAFRTAIRAEIVAVMRGALSDLADEELERKMCDRFIEQVDALDDEQVTKLLGEEAERASLQVMTSFPLEGPARAAVEASLRDRFGEDARLHFDVDPSRIAGIELRCHGHRIGWSLGDYLETLDESVQQQLHSLTQERADAAVAV